MERREWDGLGGKKLKMRDWERGFNLARVSFELKGAYCRTPSPFLRSWAHKIDATTA